MMRMSVLILAVLLASANSVRTYDCGNVSSVAILLSGPPDHNRHFNVDTRYDFGKSFGRTYVTPLLNVSPPLFVGVFIAAEGSAIARWHAFASCIEDAARLVVLRIGAVSQIVPREASLWRRRYSFAGTHSKHHLQYAHLAQARDLMLAWEVANAQRIRLPHGLFSAIIRTRGDLIMHPGHPVQHWWLNCAGNNTILPSAFGFRSQVRSESTRSTQHGREREWMPEEIVLGRRAPMLIYLGLVDVVPPMIFPRRKSVERLTYELLVKLHHLRLQPVDLPSAAVGAIDGRAFRGLSNTPPRGGRVFTDNESSIFRPESVLANPVISTWSKQRSDPDVCRTVGACS